MRAAISSTSMKPLTSTASTVLRLCPRQRMPALPIPTLSSQQRTKADAIERSAGEYERTPLSHVSPFANQGAAPTTKIPSFANYMSKKGETSNKTFQYFMVGSMGLLAAAGAKATVQGERLDRGRLSSLISIGLVLEELQWLTGTTSRLPSQHVRLRRRSRPS